MILTSIRICSHVYVYALTYTTHGNVLAGLDSILAQPCTWSQITSGTYDQDCKVKHATHL